MITVLDIGCYTGLSSIAWYEGTRKTQAEVRRAAPFDSSLRNTLLRVQIITIEFDTKLAADARKFFRESGFDDRIRLIKSRAEDT